MGKGKEFFGMNDNEEEFDKRMKRVSRKAKLGGCIWLGGTALGRMSYEAGYGKINLSYVMVVGITAYYLRKFLPPSQGEKD